MRATVVRRAKPSRVTRPALSMVPGALTCGHGHRHRCSPTGIYTYPEGNGSRARTDDLFEVVAELEPLDALPAATEGIEEAAP